MSDDGTQTMCLLLKDLARLAACVSLDNHSDPTGRCLPSIPPTMLWRVWPRVLDRVAAIGAGVLSETQREFLTGQMKTIVRGIVPGSTPDADPSPTPSERALFYGKAVRT